MTETPPPIVELIEHYGDPVPLLDHAPRTVTELYRMWVGLPFARSLTRRQRRERRWLARHLQFTARRGEIRRVTITGSEHRTIHAFLAAPDPAADQPGGPGGRPDGG